MTRARAFGGHDIFWIQGIATSTQYGFFKIQVRCCVDLSCGNWCTWESRRECKLFFCFVLSFPSRTSLPVLQDPKSGEKIRVLSSIHITVGDVVRAQGSVSPIGSTGTVSIEVSETQGRHGAAVCGRASSCISGECGLDFSDDWLMQVEADTLSQNDRGLKADATVAFF